MMQEQCEAAAHGIVSPVSLTLQQALPSLPHIHGRVRAIQMRRGGGDAPVFNAQDNKAARGKLARYVRVAEGSVSEGLWLVMVE